MPTLIVTLTCKTGVTADLDPGDLLDGEWCLLTDTGLWAFGLGGQNYYAVGPDLTAIEALTGTGYCKRTGVNTWTLTTPAPGDLAQTGAIAGNSIVWNGATWAPANVSFDDLDDAPDMGDYVTIAGDETITGEKEFTAKVTVAEVADDNTIEAGAVGLWSLDPSGALTRNARFDGADWRRIVDGYAEIIFLGNVVISFAVAGTDVAGSVITWETPVEFNPSKMILGGTHFQILGTSSDGSDTDRFIFCPAGAAGSTRGATFQLSGADSATSGIENGSALLQTAITDGAFIQFQTSNGAGGLVDVFYATGGMVGIGITSSLAARLHVVALNAAVIAGIDQGAASQTANLREWRKSDDTVYGTVSENGYFTTRKNAAPADAELAASELAWWFDDTDGTAFICFKGKTADGTVVTKAIAIP